MPKMRVSLSQQQDELKGKIELEGDAAFMLECLALQAETLAKQFKVTAPELVRQSRAFL